MRTRQCRHTSPFDSKLAIIPSEAYAARGTACHTLPTAPRAVLPWSPGNDSHTQLLDACSACLENRLKICAPCDRHFLCPLSPTRSQCSRSCTPPSTLPRWQTEVLPQAMHIFSVGWMAHVSSLRSAPHTFACTMAAERLLGGTAMISASASSRTHSRVPAHRVGAAPPMMVPSKSALPQPASASMDSRARVKPRAAYRSSVRTQAFLAPCRLSFDPQCRT